MTKDDHNKAPVQGRGALSASFPFTPEGLAALDAAIAAGEGGKAGYAAVAAAHGVSVGAVKKHRVRFPADLKKLATPKANGDTSEPAEPTGYAPVDFIYGPNPDGSIDVVIWGKSASWFMAPVDETIARARVPRDLAPPETWTELMVRVHREEFHERNPWVEEFLPLCEGLALLPSGKNKIPVDPAIGRRLEGWQSHTFSVDEIRELEDPAGTMWCLSYRPGTDSGNIISLDLDGNSASAWFRSHGAEPNKAGWRTTRAADRQKAHYRLPDELLHALVEARGEAGLRGKITLTTKEAPPGGKAEQIELFIASGQCVIAGQPSEGPPYKNHGSPLTVTEPDEAMAAALIELVKAAPKPEPRSGGEHTPGESWQSGPDSPCPVCGRNTTKACTIWVSDEETPRVGVNCHHGSTFQAPTEVDMPGFNGGGKALAKGDVVSGADGGRWVFCRQGQNPAVGVFSTFLKDRPMEAAPSGQPVAEIEGEKRPLSYGELIEAMLIAAVEGEVDRQMELRAETMSRFRRTDAQIEAALFKRHTELETGCVSKNQPKPLDLTKISGVDWLVPGFLPANDLALLYGEAGTGKTTAALVLARAVLQGTGVLDHEEPPAMGKVLFIASDSGPQPLVAAMQDLEMMNMPEVQCGDEQRFFVWAADQGNESTAWSADLRGCIDLLEFVKDEHIDLVVLDSCKAICRGTDVDYSNNHSVTALLTYLKDVIAPHTSLLLLNHDGTARNATAGAKSWKEIPSVVHQLQIEEQNGQLMHERRLWELRKSRLGPLRQFRYRLTDGEPVLCVGEETIRNCRARLMKVLEDAYRNGETKLSRKELRTRVQLLSPGVQVSEKTIDNTLSSATRGKHPEICRAGRGLYKLAPRIAQSLKGSMRDGKEIDQTLVPDTSLSISRRFPGGKSQEVFEGTPPASQETSEVPEKFPSGNDGKTGETSHSLRSSEVPLTTHGTPKGDSFAVGDRVQVRSLTGSWHSGWEVREPVSTHGWVPVRYLFNPEVYTAFPHADLRLDRSTAPPIDK
jgi:KaiC/GvpD/RAD55 family RecA-like ATPase